MINLEKIQDKGIIPLLGIKTLRNLIIEGNKFYTLFKSFIVVLKMNRIVKGSKTITINTIRNTEIMASILINLMSPKDTITGMVIEAVHQYFRGGFRQNNGYHDQNREYANYQENKYHHHRYHY